MKITFLGFLGDLPDRRAEAHWAANGNAAAVSPNVLRNCLRFVVRFSVVIVITFIKAFSKEYTVYRVF